MGAPSDMNQLQASLDGLPDQGKYELEGGQWLGNLLINKSLTLTAMGETEFITRRGSVVVVQGNDLAVELEGLSLSGGGNLGGGGLLVRGRNNKVVLRKCRIHGNEGGRFGGGISMDSGVLELDDCIIEDNHAPVGGGVMLNGTVEAVFRNTVFRNNRARQGAALCLRDGAKAALRDSRMEGNPSDDPFARGEVVYLSGTMTRKPVLQVVNSRLDCTRMERCFASGTYPGEIHVEKCTLPSLAKYHPGLVDDGGNEYLEFTFPESISEAVLDAEGIQAVLAYREVMASGGKVMPSLHQELRRLAEHGLVREESDGSLKVLKGLDDLVQLSRENRKTLEVAYRVYNTDVPVSEERYFFHFAEGDQVIEHRSSRDGLHHLQFDKTSSIPDRMQGTMHLLPGQEPHQPAVELNLPFVVLQALYNALPDVRPVLEDIRLKDVDMEGLTQLASRVTASVLVGQQTPPGEPIRAHGIFYTPSGSLLGSFPMSGGSDLVLKSAGFDEIWSQVSLLLA